MKHCDTIKVTISVGRKQIHGMVGVYNQDIVIDNLSGIKTADLIKVNSEVKKAVKTIMKQMEMGWEWE